MENSIYLALSKQVALQRNMEIVSNNVANMSTPGFRGQNLLFTEFLADPQDKTDPMSFVYNEGQYDNTKAGSVKFTENPFDIYLEGPGFMGVNAPGGETAYTRAGNLQLSANGTLLTASGFPVSGQGGGGIVVPQESNSISIDENGFVSDQNGQLGQIMMVEFDNPQELEPIGNNLYRTDGASRAAQETRIKQGQLESSNVNPIVEMNNMIKTLRSFQMVQKMLEQESQRLRTAIDKLSVPS